jgi:hypothetical protein
MWAGETRRLKPLIGERMPCECCPCEGVEQQFSARSAAKDLERFQRTGPDWTTRMLIDALRRGLRGTSTDDLTLLDVGGGRT